MCLKDDFWCFRLYYTIHWCLAGQIRLAPSHRGFWMIYGRKVKSWRIVLGRLVKGRSSSVIDLEVCFTRCRNRYIKAVELLCPAAWEKSDTSDDFEPKHGQGHQELVVRRR